MDNKPESDEDRDSRERQSAIKRLSIFLIGIFIVGATLYYAFAGFSSWKKERDEIVASDHSAKKALENALDDSKSVGVTIRMGNFDVRLHSVRFLGDIDDPVNGNLVAAQLDLTNRESNANSYRAKCNTFTGDGSQLQMVMTKKIDLGDDEAVKAAGKHEELSQSGAMTGDTRKTFTVVTDLSDLQSPYKIACQANTKTKDFGAWSLDTSPSN